MRRTAASGFSLVEVLVALVIMAFVSLLSYDAFDGVLRMEERSKGEFLEENRRSLAMSIMLNDVLHMRPRPVRDQLGGIRAAYRVPSGEYALEFTRGGLPDFDTMAGGIQRLAYRVDDGRLIRTLWLSADSPHAPQTQDQVLATGLRSMRVEQLDGGGRFTAHWPPLDENLAPDALPALVRVTLVMADGEERALLIPGVERRSAARVGGGDD